MQYANWADGQFIDASLMNASENLTQQDFAALLKGLHTPGLISAASASFTPASLVLNVGLPAPFGAVFSTGLLGNGYGTTPGIDSSAYSIDFSALVPGSGSVVAYLVATNLVLGLDPTEVVGPPIGHPDYDPAFAPFTLYGRAVNSLTLTATTVAPNNTTDMELCRFTLIAGQTVISGVDTTHQLRAGAQLSRSGEVLTSDLAVTGVTAAAYTYPKITVGVDGRLTAAQSLATTFAGNPNGNVAGTAGVSGTPPTLLFDYTNNLVWECTSTGTTSTAVWRVVNGYTGNWVGSASSGSVTVPNYARSIEAQVVGGGGGGSNCITTGLATSTSGGGGGAGGFAWGVYAVTPGASLNMSVGAGGIAGVAGASTFITGLLTATGGGGAVFQSASNAAGAAGGVGSGGTVMNNGGSYGSDGQSGTFIFAGDGGAGPWGGAGRAGALGGLNATGYGSGGGGAYDPTFSGVLKAGGSGFSGIILYRWLA